MTTAQLQLNITKQDEINFARHETFHPRFGWLKKGFEQASKNPDVFFADDATVKLGVGKNMVRSIRYWCRAFKLLNQDDDTPTIFGEQLLGTDGWDAYLEDPGSLWLLHWKLIESPCLATAWKIVFDQFRASEFTSEELFYCLSDYCQSLRGKTADSSLRKDVNCILRMYVAQQNKKNTEDSLDCPFAELGLIHTAGVSHRYMFRVGYKPTLPPEVLVYTCLCHAAQRNTTARSIPIASLLYDSGSPGLIFKVTEKDICNAIEFVNRGFESLSLADAAGKIQLFFDEDPSELAEAILNNYYIKR
ncbi:DUF4007 family protein [Spirulina sp. CCNP1310]|uniref:DUF4007 family protein n=1 Tax=Spirulina sp. CCNP1310 TaxID=3110249 RepID=UPI002B20DF61|nr:DUF4007 family protein [Spirulina sp. CCNP1310]MEA5417741.1 DUF4007 family protein [Spirulina sp. CCNP1310]